MSATGRKLTFGLTGGIASGKSTAARMFTTLGVAVVDADQLAREVVAKDSDGLRELVAAFGHGVLQASGELDREQLAAIVFAEPAARQRLNAITHPRIAQLSAERIIAAHATSTPYALYEAALLVETGAHRGLDGLIVVSLNESLQVQRAMARDGITEAAARARIAAQLPLATKVAAADYVIDNASDLVALQTRCHEVHELILQRSQ